MEFRLLGAVEAIIGGNGIRLGPPRHKFVLAVLAMEANRTVPVDRLVELSWPDSPPRTASHAIQVAVSRIRSTLASAGATAYQVSVQTHGQGYRLEIDPMRIDTHRFRALLEKARACDADEQRVALLRKGLALWRGPALEGTGPVAARDQLAHGLEEARLIAIEDTIDASLRLGWHREVLDELTGLVREYPSRERLVGQLMLALYRNGQPTSALDMFDRTRRRLADEFGLVPGPELRGLQVAVLRHDPALVLSAARDSAAPAADETTLALLQRISQRLPSAAPFAAKQVRRLLSVVDELLTDH